MKLHLDDDQGINVVRAYDARGFNINGREYTSSILISPNRISDNLNLRLVEEFDESHCEMVLAHQVEIFLLGTGPRYAPVDGRLRVWFASRGIGLEPMDTGAACRTYNILAGEGRSVGAALIPG